MTTPHINAAAAAFAEAVLLPGDPLRARWIAEHLLSDAVEVTNVRNMLGFTGTWEGHAVSVMGTGMGIPSSSIYATELIDHYGVKRLVRVGSCGAIQTHVALRDVIIAMGACTDSQVNRLRFGGNDFAAIADWDLLRATAAAADGVDATVHIGNIISEDLFYPPRQDMAPEDVFTDAQQMGVLAAEMEAAGLYGIAAERGVAALAVCTVSDHIVHQEELSSEDREQGFEAMVRLALAGLFPD